MKLNVCLLVKSVMLVYILSFILFAGPSQAEGFGQHFNISSNHDEKLFYADGNGAVVGKGKLRVTGEPETRHNVQ